VADLLDLTLGLGLLLVLGERAAASAGLLRAEIQGHPLLASEVSTQLRLRGLVDHSQHAGDRLANNAAKKNTHGQKLPNDGSTKTNASQPNRRDTTIAREFAKNNNHTKLKQALKWHLHLGELAAVATSHLGNAELAKLLLQLLKLLKKVRLGLAAQLMCLDLGYTQKEQRKIRNRSKQKSIHGECIMSLDSSRFKTRRKEREIKRTVPRTHCFRCNAVEKERLNGDNQNV
jgi:hypothetical protein